MTDLFEDELRRVLRPDAAPAGFADRVMRALPERRADATVTRLAPAAPLARPMRLPNLWQRMAAPAALAASLIIAVVLGQQMAFHNQERADAAGLAASQELMQALRVTSRKLDLAYQAVKNPPEAGVEENRS
jgi:negative regulator of sigma E activity